MVPSRAFEGGNGFSCNPDSKVLTSGTFCLSTRVFESEGLVITTLL